MSEDVVSVRSDELHNAVSQIALKLNCTKSEVTIRLLRIGLDASAGLGTLVPEEKELPEMLTGDLHTGLVFGE